MGYKIALVGNPNCGKTTTFNELTGSTQYVGNWPGVTVEKKEGKLKKHRDVATVVDLPGIYSLSPYTLEEVIARDYLITEKPDVILNIVDASNLERNLYLTHQILELGLPVVIALNMMDVIEKRGDQLDIKKLQQILGVPIIPISALKSKGLDELVKETLSVAKNEGKMPSSAKAFVGELEKAVGEVSFSLETIKQNMDARWLAIKLLEKDEKIVSAVTVDVEAQELIDNHIARLEETYDDDVESIVTNARYEYITDIAAKVMKKHSHVKLTVSDKIDRIVTNRFLALPIFFGIMWFVYWVAIQTLGDTTIGWIETLVEMISDPLGTWLETVGTADWLQGLILEGIIGGVGGVLTFVPQLMILYFFIGLLEDCGYMARVAFIMDRVFRRFGLSGRSFIPMLIGTGCSVPGIMASRTIENEKDRKMTIMLTPFIPCGAKLPVFALFVAAFFPNDAWVGPSMYLLGIGMVIISGVILKGTLFKGDVAPFVMELPEYRLPRAKGIFRQMWERGKSFIIKAGTVIFVASGAIWFLQSFNFSLQMVGASESILAAIGRALAPIFAPLGFGQWQAAVATVTGLLAKEVVVATFGILTGIGEVAETDPTLVGNMGSLFTPVSAYAFMVFTLLAAPCFAAIGAMKREFGTWKWTLIAVSYQTGLAWIMAFLIYQVGSGHFANLIIGAIVFGLLGLAGTKVYKNSKTAGCSHGCSGCSGSCGSELNK